MTLLQYGNTKTGRSIRTWSIPAIDTCPGSTPTCRDACYALAGRYRMSTVKEGLRRKLDATLSPRFVEMMNGELAGLRDGTVVRIHAAGDFGSVAYIRMWITLAKKNPHVVMFAYTRSWRIPELRRELNKLRRLPNVTLWASVDVDTGPAPRNWHTAELRDDWSDTGVRCPEQVYRETSGAHGRPHCESCRLCWTVSRQHPVKLTFKRH